MSPMTAALLAALVWTATSSGMLYQQMVGPRSTAALLETPGRSDVQCAILCHQQSACTHWVYAADTLHCSLYPAVSSAAATTTDTLYARRWVPDGYQWVPDTHKAFRLHTQQTLSDGRDLAAACARDGTGTAPAFPDDDLQVKHLKTAIGASGTAFFWIGIREGTKDGEYGNFARTRPVKLKQTWVTVREQQSNWNHTCVQMEQQGIESTHCENDQGYICQYEMY